ncbi:hypothetical protein E1178_04810 [Roseibium hamelinense]|uniref:hypothetical protein n=1 Tax=Roseibium hamelinense TaxID=150831 RepID=UPI0011A6885E|nr:hypothetical protein [Roseibium hamelinense]MTI42925.1 hypothetical protein [Roseibium hamelinense]
MKHGSFQNAAFVLEDNPNIGADYVAKALGEYEREIYPAILDGVARKPSGVINVGTSDGFYLIGLQKLLPNTPLIGYEVNDKPRETCAKLLNDWSNAVLKGAADSQSLTDDLEAYPDALVIMDIEGHETFLLGVPQTTLKDASFVIELHEQSVPGITERLVSYLTPTHQVEVVEQSGRNPYKHNELSEFDSSEKFLFLCEFRGSEQTWLVAKPKAA